MPSTVLTDRDGEILEALTHKVRLLEISQISNAWFRQAGGSRSDIASPAATRRLTRLVDAGLLRREKVNAHRLLKLEGPVLTWQAEQPRPSDFGAVSYQLKNRWSNAVRETCVFVATRRAANLFGGYGGRIKYITQVTHDIHLAEVYLHLRRTAPATASTWIGEEILNKHQSEYFGVSNHVGARKAPDAALILNGEKAAHVIEFGGAYSKARVKSFDTFCFENNLSYELW